MVNISGLQTTSWANYANYLMQVDSNYNQDLDYLFKRFDTIHVSLYDPQLYHSFLHKKEYVLILTEDTYPNDFLNLITSAKLLGFLSPIHRMKFMNSLPQDRSYPESIVLRPSKPSVGKQDLNKKVIGFLEPDGLDASSLLHLERSLFLQRDSTKEKEDEFISEVSYVIYCYGESLHSSLFVNSPFITEDRKKKCSFHTVNLMDPLTCVSLDTYPSLIFTFDQTSSSPFVYSMQRLDVPVLYVGDNVIRNCANMSMLNDNVQNPIYSSFVNKLYTVYSWEFENPSHSILFGY